MNALTSEGIILRVVDYRDYDRIVSFFTKDWGKVSALARYAKKSRRRFGSSLNLLQWVQLQVKFKDSQNLGFLERVQPQISLAGLYRDWRSISVACYCVSLVDAMTRENQSNEKIFFILTQALQDLNAGTASSEVLTTFQFRLLHASGYKPAVSECVHCHRRWEKGEPSYWVHAVGGGHCEACLPSHVPFEIVRSEMRELLESLAANKTFTDNDYHHHCGKLLYHFIRYQLGHALPAWEFMERMGLVT
jgi:DNA repair protein RecO (recombination protein O)